MRKTQTILAVFVVTLFSITFITSCKSNQSNEDIIYVKNQFSIISDKKSSNGLISINNNTDWNYLLLCEPYFIVSEITKNIELLPEAVRVLRRNSGAYELNQLYLIKGKDILAFELTTRFDVSKNMSLIIDHANNCSINYYLDNEAIGGIVIYTKKSKVTTPQ